MFFKRLITMFRFRRRRRRNTRAQPSAPVDAPIVSCEPAEVASPVEVTRTLPSYPQIAVRYKPETNPNFETVIAGLLDQIAAAPTGQVLLNDISAATPAARSAPPLDPTDRDAAGRFVQPPFPPGINVIIEPTKRRQWKEVAVPDDPSRRVRVAGFVSANEHEALDQDHAGPERVVELQDDGTEVRGGGGGSVCIVYFNEEVAWTRRGEPVVPEVALAHELVHARHSLYGEKKEGKDEEHWTTGLYKFRGDPLTENKIREELKLPRRTMFYDDDIPDVGSREGASLGSAPERALPSGSSSRKSEVRGGRKES
jgi:hypothetical protein